MRASPAIGGSPDAHPEKPLSGSARPPDAIAPCRVDPGGMTARQIDGAAAQLHELRVQTVERLGLAAVAFALALTATQLRPALAVPLLLGAMAMTFLGVRALVRRWFLLEDLALEPEAYELADVRRFGVRAASPERQRVLAHSLRAVMEESTSFVAARVAAVRPELEEIVDALENDPSTLKPQAAVALERGLHECPLLLRDASLPVTELRCRLRRLLESFER